MFPTILKSSQPVIVDNLNFPISDIFEKEKDIFYDDDYYQYLLGDIIRYSLYLAIEEFIVEKIFYYTSMDYDEVETTLHLEIFLRDNDEKKNWVLKINTSKIEGTFYGLNIHYKLIDLTKKCLIL